MSLFLMKWHINLNGARLERKHRKPEAFILITSFSEGTA